MKNKKVVNKTNYQKCASYLKESRGYFLIVALIFAISALIGFFYPVFFVDFIRNMIQELAGKTKDMNFFQLLVYIFKNNLTTSFLGMFLGLFFGIFPLFTGFFNGYILGFIANKSVDAAGYGILFRLLPHGIFEIPALIISLGLGLKLGTIIFNKNIKKTFYYRIENSLRIFLYIILPLLIIAALIETGLIFFIR